MVYVRRLRWDAWNVAHIALHGATPDEVEEACRRAPMLSDTYKGRIRLVGPTPRGRMLTIIRTPEGEDIFYAVTARPASRKERRRYDQQIGGEER